MAALREAGIGRRAAALAAMACAAFLGPMAPEARAGDEDQSLVERVEFLVGLPPTSTNENEIRIVRVDLIEDHPVVREFARAFAAMAEGRVIFHRSGCVAGDADCFDCVCDTSGSTAMDCFGNPIGVCADDFLERSCTEDMLIPAVEDETSILSARVLHAGRFRLDENNLLELAPPLQVTDPSVPGVFSNVAFSVALVRDAAGNLTSEWIVNMADNSEELDDEDNGAASAPMVIGNIDPSALVEIAELEVTDARCDCSLNPEDPMGVAICAGELAPTTPAVIMAELDSVPVIDQSLATEAEGDPFPLLTRCDETDPDDTVCRMRLCSDLSIGGDGCVCGGAFDMDTGECLEPLLCYAVTDIDDQGEFTHQCDVPQTPKFPTVQSVDVDGLSLVNNGLAPPEPRNVLDFTNNPQLTLDVRNDGCGFGADPLGDCTEPEDPSFFEVAPTGSVATLRISDQSRATVRGVVLDALETYDEAIAELEGPAPSSLGSFEFSHLVVRPTAAGAASTEWTLTGDATGELLDAPAGFQLDVLASENSFLRVVSDDVELDGLPEVPPLTISAPGGQLVARFASGGDATADLTLSDTAVVHVLDPASQVDAMDLVPIADPGNPSDPDTGLGSIAYPYSVTQREVTNQDYTDFLNAVARSDPFGLWNELMSTDPNGGIRRFGSETNYSYETIRGRAEWAVVFVSRTDAMRYANWVHNGSPPRQLAEQIDASENGAYLFDGDGQLVSPTRLVGATWFLPTTDEWYKAAYYDAGSQTYFDYPTGSDTPPEVEPPTRDLGNAANVAATGGGGTRLFDAGGYRFSASPAGTLDQAGGALEWLEDSTILLGGHWNAAVSEAVSDHTADPAAIDPADETNFIGFRVPEPRATFLAAAALLAIGALRRRSGAPETNADAV